MVGKAARLVTLRRPLSMVRRQLMLGLTWAEAARRGNLPTASAYRQAVKLWPHLAGRRPRIDLERRTSIQQAIRELPISRRAIARMYRVSPDTVQRFARAMIDRECASEGVRSLARTTRAHRCQGCGAMVTVSPCLTCVARGNIAR